LNAGDEQGWSRYTTDDWMAVLPTGAVQTKADRMGQIKGNKIANPPSTTERKWRIYGDAAIETFVLNDGAGPRRLTSIWVKQNGTWKTASVHQTLITKK
jgi:hypothetical protein